MDVRFFEPGVFFLKGNLAAGFITAGGCTACEYEKGSPKGAFRTHGGSRTHDPLLRRQLLYPTELRERTSL